MTSIRGLGWDIDTTFSSNRGDLFPVGTSYGHTGFTGTSLWIDPASNSYVIFLSSRLHPDGTGDVGVLRSRIATVAAAAISSAIGAHDRSTVVLHSVRRPAARQRPSNPRRTPSHRCLTGIDVLARDGFKQLRGKKHRLDHESHRPIARRQGDDRSASQGARRARWCRSSVPSTASAACSMPTCPRNKDEKTGLTIHSLFYKGGTGRPTGRIARPASTRSSIDLQDIGVRFYTYQLAMGYVMEEAAKRKIAVVVLDRPNPINGWQIEGPLSREPARRDAEHLHRLPADADSPRHDDGRAGAAVSTRRRRSAPT